MATKIQNLKALIILADFLSKEEKGNWLTLAETGDTASIDEAYEYFKQTIKKENKQKMQLMVKYDLIGQFEKKVTKYSDKFISKIENKQKK